jgi:hypothetical protein
MKHWHKSFGRGLLLAAAVLVSLFLLVRASHILSVVNGRLYFGRFMKSTSTSDMRRFAADAIHSNRRDFLDAVADTSLSWPHTEAVMHVLEEDDVLMEGEYVKAAMSLCSQKTLGNGDMNRIVSRLPLDVRIGMLEALALDARSLEEQKQCFVVFKNESDKLTARVVNLLQKRPN